ncbi:hypothetical protein ElyMa_003021000 [Elysia marginata]|uniref:Helitron helicase-like domain-containing protein n=1 Tax=Elysia marginata TaxID=1093978 RepID=A0AAV4IGP8_9GAST|nr:hypothetical protein ElyMa_003021000 [Elysia marginata]
MVIVRHLGKPDIFITFTGNPKWPELISALNPQEQACDCPDLPCRIFKQKFDALIDNILKSKMLGSVKAHTAREEFQKRGLPHTHILLFMDTDSKPRTTENIDAIVNAEIPDQGTNPKLYEIIAY